MRRPLYIASGADEMPCRVSSDAGLERDLVAYDLGLRMWTIPRAMSRCPHGRGGTRSPCRGTRTAAPVVSPGLEPEPASGTGAVH